MSLSPSFYIYRPDWVATTLVFQESARETDYFESRIVKQTVVAADVVVVVVVVAAAAAAGSTKNRSRSSRSPASLPS